MIDLIIVGAGPGGYETALLAAKYGWSVVLIEQDKVGGVCLQAGCIPTKNYYHSAMLLRDVQQAEPFGISVSEVCFSYEKMKHHKDEVVQKLTKNIEIELQKTGVHLVFGKASLLGPHTVQVGEISYQGRYIILATGSTPKRLDIPGIDLPGVMNSTQLLQLDALPQRMAIIGGGVIGCEFASIYASLGSQITLIEWLPGILPQIDEEVSKRLLMAFRKERIQVQTNTGVEAISLSGEGLILNLQTRSGEKKEISVDAVLLSVGRLPNVEWLSNSPVTLERNEQGGIRVDGWGKTSVPSIYAIGDLCGGWMLAHAATYQGRKAFFHMANYPDEIDLQYTPSAIFTFPPVAMIGKTEQMVRGENYSVFKSLYASNGIAQANETTFGFVKLIVSSENKLIGAHIIGANAPDLIGELTLAVQRQLTLTELQPIIHPHPTLSEIVQDAIHQYKQKN